VELISFSLIFNSTARSDGEEGDDMELEGEVFSFIEFRHENLLAQINKKLDINIRFLFFCLLLRRKFFFSRMSKVGWHRFSMLKYTKSVFYQNLINVVAIGDANFDCFDDIVESSADASPVEELVD
jgi:hypothetical protein